VNRLHPDYSMVLEGRLTVELRAHKLEVYFHEPINKPHTHRDAMSHVVRFRVPLTCTNCSSLNDERSSVLYTSSFGESRALRPRESHWRFAEAKVVPLSGASLDEAHFISRRLEELAPNPGDDADRVRTIVRRCERQS
jgi:hypothetical protein